MSVIAHDGKVVIAGGKSLSFDNLISMANETTGSSDTTLTDAVQSLIDGFGGGSIMPFVKSAVSSFTPASDEVTDAVFEFGADLDFTPNFLIMLPILNSPILRMEWLYRRTYGIWYMRKWMNEIGNGNPLSIFDAVNYGGRTQLGNNTVEINESSIRIIGGNTDYYYKLGVTYELFALLLEEPEI